MKKLIIAIVLSIFSQSSNAALAAEDAKQIHSVISNMFSALHDGRDKDVFDLQTEDTKQTSGDAAKFVAMLNDCCDALHKAIDAKFVGANEDSDTQVTIAILLLDSDGNRWGVLFVVQKETDSWKIDQIHILLTGASSRFGIPI